MLKSSLLTGNVADYNTSPVIAVRRQTPTLWAALYQSLSLMHAEDYEYRRLSIRGMLTRCERFTMMGKYMKFNLVGV